MAEEATWYHQRESAFAHLDTGGPGMCDENGAPLDNDDCEAWPAMCAAYHDSVYKCERTKRDFIDEKLKPLFVKFAKYVALLNTKADELTVSAAAVADTQIQARENERAALMAQIIQRKKRATVLYDYLDAKHALCMYYGYPAGHQIHAQLTVKLGLGGALGALGAEIEVYSGLWAAFWPLDQTDEGKNPPPDPPALDDAGGSFMASIWTEMSKEDGDGKLEQLAQYDKNGGDYKVPGRAYDEADLDAWLGPQPERTGVVVEVCEDIVDYNGDRDYGTADICSGEYNMAVGYGNGTETTNYKDWKCTPYKGVCYTSCIDHEDEATCVVRRASSGGGGGATDSARASAGARARAPLLP